MDYHTRKSALTRSMSDFIGHLLVNGAGKQMSASQSLVFPLRSLYHTPCCMTRNRVRQNDGIPDSIFPLFVVG